MSNFSEGSKAGSRGAGVKQVYASLPRKWRSLLVSISRAFLSSGNLQIHSLPHSLPISRSQGMDEFSPPHPHPTPPHLHPHPTFTPTPPHLHPTPPPPHLHPHPKASEKLVNWIWVKMNPERRSSSISQGSMWMLGTPS